jgi:DNA-binding NtrC family response regulator
MERYQFRTQDNEAPDPVLVLLVSSNERLRNELRPKIAGAKWALIEAASGAESLEYLYEKPTDILLLDPILPDLEASEFHTLVRERFPAVQILTLNSHTGRLVIGSSSPTAVASEMINLLSSGSPEPPPESRSPVQMQRIRAPERAPAGLPGMIGNSDAMLDVYSLAHKVARRDTTVLVTGESGTGKDLLAQAIHLISPRHKQPLITINCAAIPEALLEAELFGYTKGSFTGAVQSRIGRIHAAHGGTLFLDEIGDMPLSLQSKILRFLEQGEVQRIGANDNLKIDARVVAATHADLKSMAAEGRFREDLYYRLAVFPVKLPPLRARHGDLELLAKALLAKFGSRALLTQDALHALASHNWPGNVRELRNVIERATIVADEGSEIRRDHILL